MGMFEFVKLKQAVNSVKDLIGKGSISVQATQVLTELQLFGTSGILKNSEMREQMLKALFKDNEIRNIMFNDYSTLSYLLKMCADNNSMYIFLRHALDMPNIPDTIKTVTDITSNNDINIEFFDKIYNIDTFNTIIVNKLDWFPYFNNLSWLRSGNIPVNGSSSRIPAPARGYLCNIAFYKLNDGSDDGATKVVEEFKALGITVTVVIELGDEKYEFNIDSESPFFEGNLLSIYSFRCLDSDIRVYIKDTTQAEMLYSEDMFVCVTYRCVSKGSFN